MLRYKTRHNLI